MNALMSMNDFGFALVFSTIVLMASIPNALAFWKRVQDARIDNMLKWQMLDCGATADEIVQHILQRKRRDSKSNHR